LPLTEKVVFKALSRSKNRFQVPIYVRWQYKLDPSQILKTTTNLSGVWSSSPQTFLTRINKDGRIITPKFIINLLDEHKTDLKTYVLEVTLEPA